MSLNLNPTYDKEMSLTQEDIYNEGYMSYAKGETEEQNPYSGLNAEFWSDGWEDAKEDINQ